MIEPRPCPFCYSIDIEYVVDDGDDFRSKGFIVFRAMCKTCYTCGPLAKIIIKEVIWPLSSKEFGTHGVEEATAEWNERANDLLGSQNTEET